MYAEECNLRAACVQDKGTRSDQGIDAYVAELRREEKFRVEKSHVSADKKIVLGSDYNGVLDLEWDGSGSNLTKEDSVKYIQDICLNVD